jgi:DNA polymerase alpha-associated DNA helicase A
MNSKIMKISSEFMYDGQLIAHESVSDGNLKSLVVQNDTEANAINRADFLPDLTVPLLMIDTAGGKMGDCQFEDLEKKKGLMGSMSRYNQGEAMIVKALFQELNVAHGIDYKDIGVITPYSAQVDLIGGLLRDKNAERADGIEVSTVDGFQGREKEVIILS